MEAKEKGGRNPLGPDSCWLSVKKKKWIRLIDSIGNPDAFLVIVPKGINQLGSDERKRLYRISGEILGVERDQKEILFSTRILNNFASNIFDFIRLFCSYAKIHLKSQKEFQYQIKSPTLVNRGEAENPATDQIPNVFAVL